MTPVIRLRRSLDRGLRHPLLGPLLLLSLALVLAFVVFHVVEHGVEGLLFSCAIVAAASLRLAAVLGRTRGATIEPLPLLGRSPPRQVLSLRPTIRIPTFFVALPLRL